MCDDTTIQVLLPHILIGSTHVLSVAVKNAVEPFLHRNVFLLRRKSAWVNVDRMVAIMKLLGHILRPHMARLQPVLLMDALAAHIAGRVLRAAGAAGLSVVVIPPKITWLLQPADTHCFLKYKAYLRQRYQELACDAVDGRVSLTDVLLAMNSGCRKVFQAHAWSKSFDDNGFTPGQRLVRRSILNHLEWEEVPPAPPILPTLRQFAAICHNGRIFPWTTYSVHSKTPGCHRPPIHTLRPLPRRFQKTWNHGTFDCDPDLIECVLPQTPTVNPNPLRCRRLARQQLRHRKGHCLLAQTFRG